MHSRKPRPLTIAADDLPVLQAVAQSRHLPWFQVQHVRIVLAVAAGELVHAVALRMECDQATVWRLCRRYEQGGLTLDNPGAVAPVPRISTKSGPFPPGEWLESLPGSARGY